MKKAALRFIALSIASVSALSALCSCGKTETNQTTDYSLPENWAYYGENEPGGADIFFISATSANGDIGQYIAPVNQHNNKDSLSSINREKGLYTESGRFFAPYYRKLTDAAYFIDEDERLQYIEDGGCYTDVKAAFEYYIKNENNGRPFIIAGFSQGSEHGLRLLKEISADPETRDKLVAAYLIGWRVTDSDLEECPYIKMAQGETDTGVIISYECEAEGVTGSDIVPEGVVTNSINPLNWRTDSLPADSSLNLGACFTTGSGLIASEIPQLCGAYISPERGTLIVTGVTPEQYPSGSSEFPDGSYHIYDYQFFYRNLQKNVADRISAYNRERGIG